MAGKARPRAPRRTLKAPPPELAWTDQDETVDPAAEPPGSPRRGGWVKHSSELEPPPEDPRYLYDTRGGEPFPRLNPETGMCTAHTHWGPDHHWRCAVTGCPGAA